MSAPLTNKPIGQGTSAGQGASNLSTQYQKKTDKEHILDNPDTYIGSVNVVDANLYVFDDETSSIRLKNIEYIPGLYKLFDEGIVNARDHVIRMIQSSAPDKKNVTYIETDIGTDGLITFTNDGNGVDVAKHPEYDVWIPEMVFGQLRTSTNYAKDEKRIVGGKNGFGFKLVLIWSTYGRVETVDHIRGLKYVQEFRSNLDTICPPTITKVKSTKPYTKVSFMPDYARLQIGGLSPDMLGLLKKRVYDIAAVSDHSAKKIRVGYNGVTVPVKNFQQYIDLYIGPKEDAKRAYESPSDRWEYAVAISATHQFEQVSFVNGICTFKGGKHVDYILGQIVRKVCDYIEKKKKVKVAPNTIKEQLILFVRCDIENPAFDSQTKDFMNTPSAKFGSTTTVTDAFIEKVAKMGVMDMACSLSEAKEARLAKKTDGAKTKTIRGIANFIDANHGGTAQSGDCILILCEGLSAMSGIVSGLSSSDRNTIGIYPLKGKLLNVRGEQVAKVSANKEITDLKKILGLENGREYKTLEEVRASLRYGKIMIMTDQDLDGSHIKGLCINLFHSEWANLTRIPGFLSFMNTPILRAKKGSAVQHFYNEGEYAKWKDSMSAKELDAWTIKYFKGLGTSTATEFKEYFADKKIVDFVYDGSACDDKIDLLFNKKRADDRKGWLEAYDKTAFLDTAHKTVKYTEFFDNEMSHFSIYDCGRSLPCAVDGLKTSQRKILYAARKRGLTSEIKVAQFSGYVSEHSSYHHGEASLNGAIVNLAQNFVGSNNINLLEPNGQFGTRLHGGDDSASERYIFTLLNPLTKYVFPEADDAILTYLNDDGTAVEPEFYVPIIPFALVNGISGIGTGFSCNIPSFKPKDLIQNLRAQLSGDAMDGQDFIPYYQGFKGPIQKTADQRYLVRGVYEKIAEDKIRITELPVGTWTMPYTTFLEGLCDGGIDKAGKKVPPAIKDITSLCTETHVDIVVQFPKDRLAELESSRDANGINGVEKLLKLTTTLSTSNMHMFNDRCKLHKYETVDEIIGDFYGVRLAFYGKRKTHLLAELSERYTKLSNKARYIQLTLDGKIDLRRKTSEQVTALLAGHQLALYGGDYKYLIKMPMDSVTEENVAHIMRECEEVRAERDRLAATTLEQLWLGELNVLETAYDAYLSKREKIQSGTPQTGAKTANKVVVKRAAPKKAKSETPK
jgi:DNA topoisomerase II